MPVKEPHWACSRGGRPEAGRESLRTCVGVVEPDVEVAEKEKDGSVSSSVDGSTESEVWSRCCCSLLDRREIFLFLRGDVVKASCRRSSGEAKREMARSESRLGLAKAEEQNGAAWSAQQRRMRRKLLSGRLR